MKRFKRIVVIMLVSAIAAAGVFMVGRRHRSAEVMYGGASFVCCASEADDAF